jgi:hypothetical protein
MSNDYIDQKNEKEENINEWNKQDFTKEQMTESEEIFNKYIKCLIKFNNLYYIYNIFKKIYHNKDQHKNKIYIATSNN